MNEDLIKNIQNQLAQLGATTPQTITRQPQYVTMDDVNRAIDEKLKLLQSSPPSNSNNQSVPVMTALISHLKIGEQMWLSKPEVVDSIAVFLESEKGEEVVRLFMKLFREYYENKTCSDT